MNQIVQPWFVTDRVRDGLYRISEPNYRLDYRANLWLVKGRYSDLLIDTGLGVSSLKSYLADILDKPLKVVLTHIHFDHSGGCHEFDDVSIHFHEHNALREGDQHRILSAPAVGFVSENDFSQLPSADFKVEDYTVKACPQAKSLNHGDVVDLGDSAFEVLHLPGHSSGSIALYDSAAKVLFSGDVVFDGPLYDELPGSNVTDYLSSMEQVLNLDAAEVRPGHFQSFDGRRLRTLARDYIKTRRVPRCPLK
ncbi:MAG: MBL fold metallo-hydrolase [Pseudomonadota bacterium]